MRTKLEKKQEELIEILDRYFVAKTRPSLDELIASGDLKSEIAALKEQQGEKVSAEEINRLGTIYAKEKIRDIAIEIGIRENAISEDEFNDFKNSFIDGYKYVSQQSSKVSDEMIETCKNCKHWHRFRLANNGDCSVTKGVTKEDDCCAKWR